MSADPEPANGDFAVCWPGIAPVIVQLLCVPVVEEVLFRRLLFDSISEQRSTASAALFSSLAFGAWHFHNGVIGVAEATVGGVVLACLRIIGKGITLPLAFHVIINSIVTLLCIV